MNRIQLLKKKDGSTMVIYVMMLSVFITLCAIVVDIGVVALEKSRFQNALDAAALAAVQELPDSDQAEDTAVEYLEKNGFTADDISVTFLENNTEIHIQGSKEVEYFFAKILDINSVTITPKAAAAADTMGQAFDYALFSGSTNQAMIINGSSTNITGSIHTNHNFILHGSQSTISGACEAVGSLTITGNNINIGNEVPGASYVEMPDFTDIIKEQAASSGTYYASNKVYNHNVDITSSIYVNGEINVNSARFSGTGCILAKDSIVFDGSCLYSSPDDAVCFYSETGNITFHGSGSEIHGIIYAPHGTVIFDGANQTVYGRVIAKNIIFNGAELTVSVVSGSEDLKSLPTSGSRLIQ